MCLRTIWVIGKGLSHQTSKLKWRNFIFNKKCLPSTCLCVMRGFSSLCDRLALNWDFCGHREFLGPVLASVRAVTSQSQFLILTLGGCVLPLILESDCAPSSGLNNVVGSLVSPVATILSRAVAKLGAASSVSPSLSGFNIMIALGRPTVLRRGFVLAILCEWLRILEDVPYPQPILQKSRHR